MAQCEFTVATHALSVAEFENFLGRLDESVRKYRAVEIDLIVAGDFNARSVSWGDRLTKRRGDDLSAFADSLGLIVVNTGREPTCIRGRGSRVDVTFASEVTTRRLSGWVVRMDVKNMSDHNHLCYSYHLARALPGTSCGTTGQRRSGRQTSGWSTPEWTTTYSRRRRWQRSGRWQLRPR